MQQLIDYMKEKRLSLIKDLQITEVQIMNQVGDLDILTERLRKLEYQISLTVEYLSVATDILASSNERE
jgi:hypothetical protein